MSALIIDNLSASGDPSDTQQQFEPLDFKILCCRYWWFEIWNGQRLSFPFWRLYWNKNEGAYIYYKEKMYLSPNVVCIIPPHTPYSTGIENQRPVTSSPHFFKCGRIGSHQEEREHFEKGHILHFFIHFTLGRNYDKVDPGIYAIRMTEELSSGLSKIVDALVKGTQKFRQNESLDVYNLALSAVNEILPKATFSGNTNQVVGRIIDFMEKHMHTKLTDSSLASMLSMSTGSFSRMFKRSTGKSPSVYLRQIRIEKASNLLLYTDTNIDTIADICGFSDRYHLTKVFSQIKKTSPAAFRKSAGYF